MSQQTAILKRLCQDVISAIEDYETDTQTVPVTVRQAIEQLGEYLDVMKAKTEPNKSK